MKLAACLAVMFFPVIFSRELNPEAEYLSDTFQLREDVRRLETEMEQSGISKYRENHEKLEKLNRKLAERISNIEEKLNSVQHTGTTRVDTSVDIEEIKEGLQFLSGRLEIMENKVSHLVEDESMSPDWSKAIILNEVPNLHKHYASLLQLAVQNIVPRSCREWKHHAGTKSGEYLIDPDGKGGEDPFEVFCDMTAGYTFVQHNIIEEETADGCLGKACSVVDVHYNATFKQIEALKENSLICKQYIKLSCNESPLSHMWWVGSDGIEHYDWAGSSDDYTCLCGYANSCINPSKKCNCDSGLTGEWLFDSGYVSNQSALPVTKIVFGNPDKPVQIKYTLGPLQCFGQSPSILKYPNSCKDLKENGVMNSGYHYAGDPMHPFLLYCDMSQTPPSQHTVTQQTNNYHNQKFIDMIQENTVLIDQKYREMEKLIGKTTQPVLFNAVSKTRNHFREISTIVFDSVSLNIGKGYDPMTGYFTAPYDGVYAFSFHGNTQQRRGIHGAYIRKNKDEVARTHCQGTPSTDTTLGMTVLIDLKVNDTVDVIVRHGVFSGTGPHLVFMGFKVL